MKHQPHLNLSIQSRGHHEASWRHPSASPFVLSDSGYYRDLAQRAAAGRFGSIFLADTPAPTDAVSHAASNWLEPDGARRPGDHHQPDRIDRHGIMCNSSSIRPLGTSVALAIKVYRRPKDRSMIGVTIQMAIRSSTPIGPKVGFAR